MRHKKVLSALTALAIAVGMTSVPVLAEEKLNATAVISGEDTSVSLSEKVSGVVIGVKFENEVLKGIKTAEITDGNQAVLEGFEANMVYVWDSLDGMEPLCDPVTPSDATIETEAPTHAWGKVREAFTVTVNIRVTPTSVGKSSVGIFSSGIKKGHPHMRGEKLR